jgi:homoserine kinase type II
MLEPSAGVRETSHDESLCSRSRGVHLRWRHPAGVGRQNRYTSAMSSLPTDDAALVHTLLEAWSLGEVRGLERVTGGASHRVYRVESARGLAFLRVYQRADRARAEREHALIAHERAHALPAVALQVARDGSTVVEHAGNVCALYEAARGEQRRGAELNGAQASSAGAVLGRIHRALASLQDVGYLRWALNWDGPAWVERLNVVERAILTRPRPLTRELEEGDRWALERLRAQRAWLAHPDCVHSYRPLAAAQVVHGDYQDANLFFEGDRVSAVIDWDQAAVMPRSYELARAAGFMFRLEPARTLRFLAGYASENPIEPAALDDGARAWGCFADHHVWPLEEVYLNGNPAARRYIPHAPFRPFQQAWAELGAGSH